MNKKILVLLFFLQTGWFAKAQEVEVTVMGQGSNRTEALNDAFRMAVGQAFGTEVDASTVVNNYMVVKDAISTRTQGIVQKYEILKEEQANGIYSLTIKAIVNTKPFKQDATTLSQMLGGLKFCVIYDDRTLTPDVDSFYDFCRERINEKLAEKTYSYVETSVFTRLSELLKKDTASKSEISYINNAGIYTNSEFIIQIKSINIRTTPGDNPNYKVTLELKTYDNCTSTGLGTIVAESDWKNLGNKNDAVRLAITDAVNKYYDRLMYLFSKYMGDWINNGAPFEVRFYSFEVDDMAWFDVGDKFLNDKDTKETPTEIRSGNFYKVNLRNVKSPYVFNRFVYGSLQQVEAMKTLSPSPQLLYGRQLSYTPKGIKVQEIFHKQEMIKRINQQ